MDAIGLLADEAELNEHMHARAEALQDVAEPLLMLRTEPRPAVVVKE